MESNRLCSKGRTVEITLIKMANENQKKGRKHIKYIFSVACNIYKHSGYNKQWTECLWEAMQVHRNYLIFMENHNKQKREQQWNIL